MPPPITNPATAAPTIAAWRFSVSCPRQSVRVLTFARRSLTENASSWRVVSIEVRISAGVRCGVAWLWLWLWHQTPRPSWSCCTFCCSSMSRVRLASSMARSGVGGAPPWSMR